MSSPLDDSSVFFSSREKVSQKNSRSRSARQSLLPLPCAFTHECACTEGGVLQRHEMEVVGQFLLTV